MAHLSVPCSKKAQLQIQQMAFVLVALLIFFSMAALIYFSIMITKMRADAGTLKEKEALELARATIGTPEFTFTARQCSSCIDLDKVLFISERPAYKTLWNLDYLIVKRVFPPPPNNAVCTKINYPDCGQIVVIENKTATFGGTPPGVFVTTVRWVPDNGGYFKYELGRIYVSPK